MNAKEIAELCANGQPEYGGMSIVGVFAQRELGMAYLDLLAENERMRAALEWYADPEHWTIPYIEGNLGDWGTRAREVLKRDGDK